MFNIYMFKNVNIKVKDAFVLCRNSFRVRASKCMIVHVHNMYANKIMTGKDFKSCSLMLSKAAFIQGNTVQS